MSRSRRSLLLGIAAACAVVAVVVAGGVTAARTLFGPEAFVQSYLAALQRGDAAGALLLAVGRAASDADHDPASGAPSAPLPDASVAPGGAPSPAPSGDDPRAADRGRAPRPEPDRSGRGTTDGSASIDLASTDTSLLTGAALAPFEVLDIRDRGDAADGAHAVEVTWAADGATHRTVLTVAPDAPRGIIFPGWRFAEAPLTSLELVTRGDPRVDVNGIRIEAPERSRFTVFVPGVYRVGHTSLYLEAEPVTLAADTIGKGVVGRVEPTPTERLRADVTAAATRFLDECAAQEVLYPTGCPFGSSINERVLEPPAWTITDYPELEFSAARSAWRASGEGSAHLRVRIQRIFDGSRAWVEEDIRFVLRLEIEFGPDDHLIVTPDGRLAVVT